ncbi:MAG: UDP-glucose--hexose-1-phosphate uridylyltransferase [Candidatus Latescibacterota bacterium]|nr:UDP-glucose--hexose-1-phosphate uridylyltransferase [Candidatus Latescibacterota bacterium]
MFELQQTTHRRWNALTGQAIQVSPHRMERPWQGREEEESPIVLPAYDPHCYLCPGNTRSEGRERNLDYDSTYVFDNDFSALQADVPAIGAESHPLLRASEVRGTCRVLCFSPRHDLTLARMSVETIGAVVDVWSQQVEELSSRYRWVQVFENKGELMGCSNPHPHGQIWALDTLPAMAAAEDKQQRLYTSAHGGPLLVDYADLESECQERVVDASEYWLAVVPWWAEWPFELLLLPRRRVGHLPELTIEERRELAQVLQRCLARYDNLFRTSFPYSMGWHGAPVGDGSHWQLHAHFFPPLLRSATVRKFMVGYEMLAEPQRDLTAEAAAALLRDLPLEHYANKD